MNELTKEVPEQGVLLIPLTHVANYYIPLQSPLLTAVPPLRRRMCRACGATSHVCGRCDGAHPSEECPHYRRARYDHADACPLPAGERPLPSTSIELKVASGTLTKMAADGSCLYHALSHGAGRVGLGKPSATDLRRTLAHWARDNARLRIATKTLRTWLHWETGGTESFASYVAAQAESGWGGVIEIIGAAHHFHVAVAVWVPVARGRFRQTGIFAPDSVEVKGVINVCRVGGVHYDHLELHDDARGPARVTVRACPAAGRLAQPSLSSYTLRRRQTVACPLVRRADSTRNGCSAACLARFPVWPTPCSLHPAFVSC